MKKLLTAVTLIISLVAPLTASAASSYQQRYNAVYGSGGSYWQIQQASQATYWKSYNNTYGKGGLYCQLYGWNC